MLLICQISFIFILCLHYQEQWRAYRDPIQPVWCRGGSRLQIRLRQNSVIKAPISFPNIHKLLWKSKILVHGHVRIFLNFVTFPLIVLIKIVQVIKNIVFGTRFVINNKPPLKKENSYAWLDYVVPEIFAGVNLG